MKKKILILLTGLLISSSPLFAAPVQWAVADGGNDHWYEIVRAPSDNIRMTWTEAKDLAALATFNGLQGHLATLTTEDENDFVGNTTFLGASYHNLYGDNVWIGGYQLNKDDEPSGNWAWVTGETWVYENWETGQPDNGGAHHVQDYLRLGANQWNLGRWNDVDHVSGSAAGYGAAYIIEYEPVPVPGAILLFGSGLIGFVGLKRRLK